MPDITKEDEEYKRMLAHAISQIAVYSDEWTSRLPSDPGITTIENLTAFLLLLKEKYSEVPEAVKPVLPQILGITPGNIACARVLLSLAGGKDKKWDAPYHFLKHQKFFLDDLCFETLKKTELFPGKVKQVFREHRGLIEEQRELTFGNPLSAKVFGECPEAGDALYLLFDGPFSRAGGDVLLYVNAQKAAPRAPSDKRYPVCFAQARWSCLTKNGYEPAECFDSTNVFLTSGELRLRLGKNPPVLGKINGCEGYLLRCSLLLARYDQIPCIKHIEGPLFEVYERDSKAMSFEAGALQEKELRKELEALEFMGEEWYLFTYEGNAKEGYLEVTERGKPSSNVRSCPPKDLELRKLVCMNQEMAVQRELGILYGYDRQEFPLTFSENVVPDSLEIMAERVCGKERRVYFFAPGDTTEGAVRYECGQNLIRILDAGDFEGCRIFVSSCAVCHGEAGNVLAGNTFLRGGGKKGESYYNPLCGIGGKRAKGPEEMKSGLKAMLARPKALVTEEDYEQAVKQVPGLCIHKVRALRAEDGRRVQIYVKPYGRDKLPKLSELYRRQIRRYLEEKRLLGVSLEIAGPKYIAIQAQAVIFMRMQYANGHETVKSTIRQELNHVGGTHGFGGIVSRQDIINALEELSCVESVLQLKLTPEGMAGGANSRDLDILLLPNALCYAGDIQVEWKRSSFV